MRTKNLFRTLAAAALVVVSMSAFGQLTNSQNYTQIGALTDGSFIDTVGQLPATPATYYEYVTVGSTMPYAVRKDPSINLMIASGLYANSVFWLNVHDGTSFGASRNTATFQIGDTAALATAPRLLLNADVTNPLTIAAGQQAFPVTKDTVYAINWKTKGAIGAITDRTIWTYEWPVSNTLGMTACPGDSSSLTVRVVDKPNIDWTDNSLAANGPWVISSCGGGDNLVEVDYTGFGNVTVSYDSTRYTLANVAIPATTGTKTTTFTQAFGVATATAQQLTHWTPTPAQVGSYVEYTITYVNDLISRKSLSRYNAVYGCIAGAAAADPTFAQNTIGGVNMPGHKYRVYSLPVPSSRPIKHIANTGW